MKPVREPKPQTPPAQQQAAPKAAAAPAPTVAETAPPPPVSTVTLNTTGLVLPDGIYLTNPRIELGGYLFVDGLGQVNRLRPKRAVIVAGAIVIEELNLILPLVGNYVRT